MSRFDGKFEPAGATRIDPAELLTALGELPDRSARDRQAAIARCLSASEGWKNAIKVMEGAFAPDVAGHMVKDD